MPVDPVVPNAAAPAADPVLPDQAKVPDDPDRIRGIQERLRRETRQYHKGVSKRQAPHARRR